MKLIFVGSSLGIIYFMRYHKVVRQTYDASEDTFRTVFLLVPCAVLALAINQQHNNPVEVRPTPSPSAHMEGFELGFYESQGVRPGTCVRKVMARASSS